MDQDKTNQDVNVMTEGEDNRTPIEIVSANIKERYVSHPNEIKYIASAQKKLTAEGNEKALKALFDAIYFGNWRTASALATDAFQNR